MLNRDCENKGREYNTAPYL